VATPLAAEGGAAAVQDSYPKAAKDTPGEIEITMYSVLSA
jgi:hypothetical protein